MLNGNLFLELGERCHVKGFCTTYSSLETITVYTINTVIHSLENINDFCHSGIFET